MMKTNEDRMIRVFQGCLEFCYVAATGSDGFAEGLLASAYVLRPR